MERDNRGGSYKRWEKERREGYHPYGRGRSERRDDRRSSGGRERRDYNDDSESENRLRSLIVRIGDKTAGLAENLEKLATALEGDMPKHKTSIVWAIIECVLALPVKTPIYATLVGLLNLKNFDFGKEIVQRASTSLQEALDKFHYDGIKFILRFLGELVNSNVLLPSSVTDVLISFLDVLHEDNLSPRRAEFFVFLVMMTIPWVGKELMERKSEEFGKIWGAVETFITKVERKANPILYVYDNDAGNEFLDEGWKRIQQLRRDGWETSCILKPWVQFEGKLNNALQHTIPPVVIPPHTSNGKYNHPRTKFRLFDTAESEKGLRPIDRLILEDYIVDILYYFSLSHKEAVMQFDNMPTAVNIDMLITETVFSQLFRLPKPPVREIYYGDVIGDLCKQRASFPPILGQALEVLFERIDSMDAECIDRFATWFSHHLSNFDFKWNWAAWDYALKLKADSWKPTFIRELLERTMRLSYFERIKKSLPDEFHRFLPEKPTPIFKYEAETTEGYAEAKMLLQRFQAKETAEVIQSTVMEGDLFSKFSAEDKLDIMMHCIIKMGSKSFSHLLAAIERYLPLMQKYVNTQDAKMIALRAVKHFWQKSPQNIIIMVDRLMTYRIIDNTSIVNWLFSPEEQPNFTRGYIWDILRITISKTLARTETVREELKVAEEAWERVPKEEQNESFPEFKRLKDRKASLDTVLREQKELFLIIFQRFCMCISEYLGGELNASYHNEFWYSCTVGHLKEVGRKYHNEIVPFMSTLETLLFSNVDPRLAAVFQHIKNI